MTFLVKQVLSLFKLLNSDTGTNQIASGIACGLILGFAPFFSLQTALVILLLLFFRIQIGAAFIAAFFFSLIAWALDPIANLLGIFVLELPSLKTLFTSLYNMPIVPLTRFNNSIVMGSGILTVLLFPIIFFVSRILIAQYRETIVTRYKQTRFFKLIQASTLYKLYAKYDELY